jgi:hypothetical protein
VPADRVVFWDFDAAAEPDTPRDTSGTAIAAAVLLKLAALAPEETQRARYQSKHTTYKVRPPALSLWCGFPLFAGRGFVSVQTS